MKELGWTAVGRKPWVYIGGGAEVPVPKSDTVKVLAPSTVEAGQAILISADPPTYDFRPLACRIAGAEPERINRELNGIYISALHADLREREAGAKTTRRALRRLWKVYDELPIPAARIVAAKLHKAFLEGGIHLAEGMTDREVSFALTGALLRAAAEEPRKRRGPRGTGARVRLALRELVDLYCRETGAKRPYRDNGKWRRLEAVEFASVVLDAWQLKRASDTPASLAGVWSQAAPPAELGESRPK